MTGSFTNFWETAILKHVFGILAYSAPGTVYVGVCTGGVTEAGVITGEPSGGSYARVAVTNSGSGWDYSQVDGLTKIANHAAIQFPTATGNWGTITDVFISTAATGGDILAFATLDAPKAIGVNDTLKFDASGLAFALD
jgi:hypothetical protein